MRSTLLLFVLLTSGCSAARLVGPSPVTAPDPEQPRTVVLEPFFETTEWELSTRTETAQVYGPMGQVEQVSVARQVAEKPLYARIESLAAEHQRVLRELQRLRPVWRVTSTGGLPAVSGPSTLVRVVVGRVELVESNRTAKNLSLGFGVVLWPLLIYAAQPVHEVQRVHGRLWRYDVEAEELRKRLLKYPTQPDYAVDTRGLTALDRRFGLDVEFEEGVLAKDLERGPVLLDGFSARLATAIVAIVEEQR